MSTSEKATHAGQSSHSTRNHKDRTSNASATPMISASAVCRLGIAAYGFSASSTIPLPWLSSGDVDNVSMNPIPFNSRGGAVGTST